MNISVSPHLRVSGGLQMCLISTRAPAPATEGGCGRHGAGWGQGGFCQAAEPGQRAGAGVRAGQALALGLGRVLEAHSALLIQLFQGLGAPVSRAMSTKPFLTCLKEQRAFCPIDTIPALPTAQGSFCRAKARSRAEHPRDVRELQSWAEGPWDVRELQSWAEHPQDVRELQSWAEGPRDVRELQSWAEGPRDVRELQSWAEGPWDVRELQSWAEGPRDVRELRSWAEAGGGGGKGVMAAESSRGHAHVSPAAGEEERAGLTDAVLRHVPGGMEMFRGLEGLAQGEPACGQGPLLSLRHHTKCLAGRLVGHAGTRRWRWPCQGSRDAERR